MRIAPAAQDLHEMLAELSNRDDDLELWSCPPRIGRGTFGAMTIRSGVDQAFESGGPFAETPRRLTAAQRASVSQVVGCPFQGSARRLYLEARALELLAYEATDLARQSRQVLSTEDVAHVREAARILVSRLEDPPTLRALARAVGVNERKLTHGFHEVFGTTVFGYLRTRRLEAARRSLLDGSASVASAARFVGYRCPSRFTAAFQKHFGETPSSVRRGRSISLPSWVQADAQAAREAVDGRAGGLH